MIPVRIAREGNGFSCVHIPFYPAVNPVLSRGWAGLVPLVYTLVLSSRKPPDRTSDKTSDRTSGRTRILTRNLAMDLTDSSCNPLECRK